jgi:pimeloyl-ACP methyl ester carboxylesterase
MSLHENKNGSPAMDPTLIFVHGFLDGGTVWNRVRSLVETAGFKTVAVNLPGMGGVDAAPEEISLPLYAELVLREIDRTESPLILIGHSMGAQVVDLVSARAGHRVKALVLVTPVPLEGVHAPIDAIAPLKTSGGKPEIQTELRKGFSHALDDDAVLLLAELARQVMPGNVARLVDVWNDGDAEGQGRSSYEGPVLVLRGASDPFVDEGMASRVAGRFTGATVTTILDAGHWAQLEQPAAVAEQITTVAHHALSTGGALASAGDWKGVFSSRSTSNTTHVFADDVVLDASVMPTPARGREAVSSVMDAASKIYSEVRFTDSAATGNKQYLEWVATGRDGVEYRGITILTRDIAGALAHIAIHHRPLGAAMHFSKTLAAALKGTAAEALFLAPQEAH